jgi:hypothetical protein
VLPDNVIQELFGRNGLRILSLGAAHFIVERGANVTGLARRCRAAVSDLTSGDSLGVVIVIEAVGITRLLRWIGLPAQRAAVTRAIRAEGAVLIGQYAVAPDLGRPAVVYELHSPAQRYAEAFLMPTPPERAVMRRIRGVLSRWGGCDPAAGAIVIIGRKP